MASHQDHVERLSSLVDGLRDQNRAEGQTENQEALSRLFPSTRRNPSTSSAAGNRTNIGASPQFHQWSELVRQGTNSPRQRYAKSKAGQSIKTPA